MVAQMQQNYLKSNYIFKKKICMIFTKTCKNIYLKQIFVSLFKKINSVKKIHPVKQTHSVKD